MKFVALFRRFEENLISLLVVTMTLLVFIEVIMRFVFNSGIHWVQEVTLFSSAWLELLGAILGYVKAPILAWLGVVPFLLLNVQLWLLGLPEKALQNWHQMEDHEQSEDWFSC